MRLRHSLPDRSTSSWRLAGLVFAIIVGVIGMHTLAMSCVGGDSRATALGAGQQHSDHASTVPVSGTVMSADPAHDPPGSDMVVALCMAAAIGFGLLWAGLISARTRRVAIYARRALRTRLIVPAARPQPPPSLSQLSILRC